MLLNYLIIAFRNALRNRVYSLINLLGLAIGIASSVIILLFVLDELSYDRHNEHFGDIYRICIRGKIQGNEIAAALSNAPMGATLKSDYPEVEESARLYTFDGDPVVRYGDKVFIEEDFYYADSTFFNVFTAPVVFGDPKGLLNRPNTMVLTEEIARKYFGDEDPVGKLLTVGERETEYEISGVVKAFPENSHFRFNMLGSMTSIYIADVTRWLGNNNFTYIRLREKADPEEVESQFPSLVAQHMGTELEEILGLTIEEFFAAGNTYGYYLQPLKEIHLESDLQFEINPGGSKSSVIIFSVIAIFLIIIASINFMNLATARGAKRATEVGIRKVAGADKQRLISQFLAESFLVTIVALILAIVLVELFLPGFNKLSGKSLELDSIRPWHLCTGLLLIGLFVGFASGSYPAFFLSSFKPVDVLKSGAMRGIRGAGLRKVLVTLQFVITIVLFICTLIVNGQMKYIQVKDLGFEKENLVIIDRTYVLDNQTEAFRQELLKNPSILQATYSSAVPGGLIGDNAYLPEGAGSDETHAINNMWTDWHFKETYRLELIEGRWFQEGNPTDSTALILNESAVKALSFEDPLSKRLYTQFGDDVESPNQIIGVIKDFHFQSLHQEVRPLVLQFIDNNQFQLSVRISGRETAKTLEYIQKTWTSFKEQQPIHMTFLEEDLAELYNNDEKAATVFSIFSVLAIFIAALGLLGLASFSAAQRTKEVGIRKAMGASIPGVLFTLSQEFIWLILIATLAAWPLGYFIMKGWLQDFPVRVPIEPQVFIISSLLAFFIAAATVLLRVYQAASMNPVSSLRYE
ncbi:MAG: FtsX-like permease family protein [Bacteroidetes bacterium]|nr:FtsX-like permease family protein [Bacteroidota bacterium]